MSICYLQLMSECTNVRPVPVPTPAGDDSGSCIIQGPATKTLCITSDDGSRSTDIGATHVHTGQGNSVYL